MTQNERAPLGSPRRLTDARTEAGSKLTEQWFPGHAVTQAATPDPDGGRTSPNAGVPGNVIFRL